MAAKVILESPSSVLQSVNIWPSATCFAVSAEETFSDDGRVFNYINFYKQVCKYLEAPRFQAQAQILIVWWNRKLFPNSIHSGGMAGSTGGVQDSMLLLLEAELEVGVDDDNSDV
ncbi:hypothetical protein OPQ81_005388 [Rhizoctonia solani]|nr:hypothetical protein OPQ81_005388 [Rhizoctonia solani]